jgi:hypothetical protein
VLLLGPSAYVVCVCGGGGVVCVPHVQGDTMRFQLAQLALKLQVVNDKFLNPPNQVGS